MKNSAVRKMIADQYNIELDRVSVEFIQVTNDKYAFKVVDVTDHGEGEISVRTTSLIIESKINIEIF